MEQAVPTCRRPVLATVAAAALVVPALTAALSPAVAAGPRGGEVAAGAADDALGRVTGRVVDGNGDPVAGALVNVLRPREVVERGIVAAETARRAWTKANGRFSVRQAGQYLVQVCVPDRGDKTVCRETAQGVKFIITYAGPAGVTNSWVTQTSLFQGDAADRALGAITVMPQGFVEGHVAGAAFQPIQLLRLNGTVAYRDSTDDNGDFRLRGLAPGPYRLSAGGNGFLPAVADVLVRAHRTATVELALDRGGVISGVLRSGAEPVPFTDVIIKSGGEIVAAATTSRRGVYRASGFPTGDYRLGITYFGTPYQRNTVHVAIDQPDDHVVRDIAVRRGAVVTLDPRQAGSPVSGAENELRDSTGTPILQGLQMRGGRIRYQGLEPGTYTAVVSDGDRYARKTFTVASVGRRDLGRVFLSHPTFTLSGRTAPRAVVEAFTGDLCPPAAPDQPGTFHFIADRADASGHYTLPGLVPGRYMLGSDGWPHNDAPRCWSGVRLTGDTVRDLPLAKGAVVSGRMVYAATGTPIITALAYELRYQSSATTNPTDEHPPRALSTGATGEFAIDALGPGEVAGSLAQTIDDAQINNPEFFVIFPYQDFTPYYLESGEESFTIDPGERVGLGDIPLTLRGAPL
jgi:hypothetical protein